MRALLLLVAVAATAQVRDTLPVPDIPGYRTLKCDFHLHTAFSDGEVWPTVRVSEAFRDGLDAIAITDHNGYSPHKQDLPPNNNRANQIAQALGEQVGILVIPGIEVNRDLVHLNALFVTDANALREIELPEALNRARAQKAFVFWNHPGWRRPKAIWLPEVEGYHKAGLFTGMELLNGEDFYPEAYPWVEEKKLTIFANSDEHGPVSPGRTRPVTLVFARERSLESIREALIARRTAAWMNGQVWGSGEHLSALWRGAVVAENPQMTARPGARAGFWLRNTSALPFTCVARNLPAWLTARDVGIKGESTSGVVLSLDRKAPAGEHRLELEFEITNFHTGPGANLVVKVPVTIKIA